MGWGEGWNAQRGRESFSGPGENFPPLPQALFLTFASSETVARVVHRGLRVIPALHCSNYDPKAVLRLKHGPAASMPPGSW